MAASPLKIHSIDASPGVNLKIAFLFLSSLSLCAAYLVAYFTPATGAYKIAFYQEYSLSVWICLALVLIVGFIVMFIESKRSGSGWVWAWGFVLVAAANLFILLIPIMRDYAYSTQWDSVVHAARIKNILFDNRPDFFNMYPLAHVLASSIVHFTGLQTEVVVLFHPVIFYLIYLASTAFLAHSVYELPEARRFMVVLALPLVFGQYSTIFRPMQLAIYIVPAVVGWLARSRQADSKVADRLIFVVLLVSLPLIHPWAAVIGLLLIILFAFAKMLVEGQWVVNLRSIVTPLLMLGVFWLAWFRNYIGIFSWTIRSFIRSVTQFGSEPSLANTVATSAQRSGVSVDVLVSLAIAKYGQAFLYSIPVVFVLIWFVSWYRKQRREISPVFLALIIFIIVMIGLAAASIFFNLITEDPLRLFSIAVAVMPFIVSHWFINSRGGRGMSDVLPKGSYSWLLLGIVIFTIGAGLLGALSTYPSPLTGTPGYHFTYAQRAGVDFALGHIPPDGRNIYSITGNPMTIYAIWPYSIVIQFENNLPQWQVSRTPAHFGYAPDYMGLQYENPGYMLVTVYDLAYYTQLWSEGGRFTREDFEYLELDPAWDKVYTSGDMIIWHKNPLEFNLHQGQED